MDVTSLERVARLVGSAVPPGADPQTPVGPDVVIDSRRVTASSLFIALPGERVDGHEFVASAADSGAAAALVARPVDAGLAELVVGDTQTALSDLARGVVETAVADGLTTIALTGSSGKTSTKDLLAQVLATHGQTVAPVGSQNNEIGVPLTACRVTAATRFLVSEMGARGIGHIASLCAIVPPRIGMVLNIGTAHLGEFKTREVTALAKSEIVTGLPPDGWAVLSATDPYVSAMAGATAARIAWFAVGEAEIGHPGALFVRADALEADDSQRYSFTLHVTGEGREPASHPVSLSVIGAHQVANAAAAAAAAIAAGMQPTDVAVALSAARPQSRWRMEVTDRPDGVTVINDAYNANPESMAAGLATAAALIASRRRTHPEARLFAVLGEMMELGDAAPAEHREVGRLAADAGVGTLLAVGGHADEIVAAAGSSGVDAVRVSDAEEAIATLDAVRPYDIVLIKASRGVGLEVVADALLRTQPC